VDHKSRVQKTKNKNVPPSEARFDDFSVALRHVPQWASAISVSCNECKKPFHPNLLDKRGPYIPIRQDVGDGRWVPLSAPVKCPHCGDTGDLKFPIVDQTARYIFFGDEAYRDEGGKFLLTYTLLGTNALRVAKFEEAVKSLKKEIEPARDAESWTIHMKDIWSGSNRNAHPVFKTWNSETVEEFRRRVFELIADFDDGLLISNIVAVVHNGHSKKTRVKERKMIRHEAFTTLVASTIDTATRAGVVPKFFFDTDKDKPSGPIIHQWAEESFHGSQVCLLWPLLARGLSIDEPTFVAPASRPLLEIADVVCYVIARYVFQRIQNKVPDIDPSDFGRSNTSFMAFDALGNVRQEGGFAYPWNKFFANAGTLKK
jgi:hypothetical protein